MQEFEFWPDYGPGPVWASGVAVPLDDLGLPDDLAAQLRAWNARYEEDKLPIDESGDGEWLDEGRRLLDALRTALGSTTTVVVTEPWWTRAAQD